MMSNLTTIHERTASLPKQGDASADSPVVSGVKVLGIESKNGRKYPIEVMRKALEKYEGAIVNIDHPAGSEPRSYEDRFGRLTNARMEADGIYADLAYNPKHPLAEGFQWWVKNDPKAIGLSHNAQAKTKMNTEGVEEIEEIVKVDSVDLVAEPATTAGLMECVMKAKKIEEAKLPRQMSLPELRNAEKKLNSKDSQLNDKIIDKGWGNFTNTELISKHGNDSDVAAQKKIRDELKEIQYQIDRRGKGYKPEKESKQTVAEVNPEFSAKVQKFNQGILDKLKVAAKKDGVSVMTKDGNKYTFTKVSQKSDGSSYRSMDGVFYKDNPTASNSSLTSYATRNGISLKFKESKPTKKLNVTEAKKRKAFKRMLVSEAIKEILTIRKGV